jgi:hypothetical protein
MGTTWPRQIASETCAFCDAPPDDACPLDDAPPFAGPAIGAAVGAVGECEGGEVCEACQ